MKKVYAVFFEDYYESDLDALFKKKKKAEKYVSNMKYPDKYIVREIKFYE